MVWGESLWIGLYGFLGLVFGYILTRIAPEEMEVGERLFKLGRNVCLFLIGIFWFFNVNFVTELALLVVFGMLMGKLLNNLFSVLGLGVGVVSGNLGLVLGTLVFLIFMFESGIRWKESGLFFVSLPYVALLILGISFGKYFDANYVLALVSGFCWAYAYKSLKN
ncbi:hypothetical protein HN992_00705 [Candidatus Woesearchaeota archaeon]|jgi:hypothetical protein|nr:hypothetical protein [Candidatus Woesearchaeota archaeon]MBT3438509.1 hypothetical protein [Candidatus Woesearchaeota archaeon]MBT4058409.1 hypothetical protein [Candidatus Woesearchaeota archaeon]MBT4207646.1 hypothetical protein [Candidatus Woesearchaeota archaeon]MBT4730591.1 hypothetical protein [Candidatus Woesearchaeota archaeon]